MSRRVRFKLRTMFFTTALIAVWCGAFSWLSGDLSEEARYAVIGLVVLPAATFTFGLLGVFVHWLIWPGPPDGFRSA
jgi:hypothetical protein